MTVELLPDKMHVILKLNLELVFLQLRQKLGKCEFENNLENGPLTHKNTKNLRKWFSTQSIIPVIAFGKTFFVLNLLKSRKRLDKLKSW